MRSGWEVASDGGVFTFGSAGFSGRPATHVSTSVVGMARTADDGGYWLVASDGGILPFGDATYYGSAGGAFIPGSDRRDVVLSRSWR